MVTRPDATPLSIGDRFYLMEAAINMIDEGIAILHEEAVEEGIDPDNENLLDSLDDLRMTSYSSLLHTMTNDKEEAKALITMMRQENSLDSE
jgi:hypothetical protein